LDCAWRAAGKLKSTEAAVEEGMNALGFLMLEAARVGLSDAPMVVEALGINDLALDDEAKAAIAGHFAEHITELRKIISGQQLTTPHFRDLEWRLDVQIATRSVRQIVEPTYLLKLVSVATPAPPSPPPSPPSFPKAV
jgi:hypothetical protein